MGALSYTHATSLLNYSLRNNTVYLALFTSNPAPDGSGTEVSGGAYARKAVTFGAPSLVGGVETCSNSAAVAFDTATTAWGSVAYWAIFSASTGGTLLWYGAFSRSKTIDVDDSITVPIGNLVVTLS